MIKKYFPLLFLVFFFADIFAETVDIDVPDVIFSYKNGSVVPRIKGFELDGTGEETILPFKKMVCKNR